MYRQKRCAFYTHFKERICRTHKRKNRLRHINTSHFYLFRSLKFPRNKKEQNKKAPTNRKCFSLEVTPGFEPGNQGFADPCLTTWLCHRMEKGAKYLLLFFCGAGDEESAAAPPAADEARRFRGSGTIGAHPKGGRESYRRDGERRDAREMKWSGRRGSNSLPPPWQGGALPDELRPQMVPPVGVEPTTRGFSIRCSTN